MIHIPKNERTNEQETRYDIHNDLISVPPGYKNNDQNLPSFGSEASFLHEHFAFISTVIMLLIIIIFSDCVC